VVNLDGAFGEPNGNQSALAAVVAVGLQVQFGGGLRDAASLARVFDLGIARAVIGTAALEDPALVDGALAAYGADRIAVGVDARAGQVRVRGWTQAAPITALALAQRLRGLGLEWCVFTDIARDGVGTGVNVSATQALAAASGLRLIASGGVASPADVLAARQAGLEGVIIGRALYEGQVQLADVIGLETA
jgi:phosphoribosylformimino-5-aminoimidazole carboxamide ribotide isomerase